MKKLDPIFEVFGGVRPLARKLEIAPTTIQSWRDVDRIPQKYWVSIISAAKDEGAQLSYSDFLGVSA